MQTRLLGAILAQEADLASRLGALGAGQWRALLQQAGEELLTPELAGPLSRRPCALQVPEAIADHLQDLLARNAERTRRIGAQLAEILPACHAAGLRALLLKGARSFVTGAAATARVMIDLDLLFPTGDLAAAALLLRRLGYRRLNREGDLHTVGYFARPGEPALIDLHREVMHPVHLLPASQLLSRARRAMAFGAPVLVADAVDDALHAILHEMVHHEALRHGDVCVRRLHDIRLRIAALGDADWAVLEERVRRAQAEVPVAAALRLVGAVFGAACVPDAAQAMAQHPWARLALWRALRKHRGALPQPVDWIWGNAVRMFASYQHRPGQDVPLTIWRAMRVIWGLRRAAAAARKQALLF